MQKFCGAQHREIYLQFLLHKLLSAFICCIASKASIKYKIVHFLMSVLFSFNNVLTYSWNAPQTFFSLSTKDTLSTRHECCYPSFPRFILFPLHPGRKATFLGTVGSVCGCCMRLYITQSPARAGFAVCDNPPAQQRCKPALSGHFHPRQKHKDPFSLFYRKGNEYRE